MQLLMSPASPFVRKVRVLLREANLMDAVEEVSVTTTPMESAAQVLAANPVGKIPTLIRGDAPALYDSRVITRFLDDHAGSGLYPQARIWDVLTLEATGDAIMEASVGMTYEMRFRSDEMQFDAWLDAQWNKAARAIEAVESRWMSHLEGPLTMGHVSIACALGYIDLRHDNRGWRQIAPNLADWHAGFSQRSSMVDTIPS